MMIWEHHMTVKKPDCGRQAINITTHEK